jgi:hypothetical protein
MSTGEAETPQIDRSHYMRILIENVDISGLTVAHVPRSLLNSSCPLPVAHR